MNAEILSVGTELLLGQIVNTDAQFLSRQLAELGIDVYAHSVVGDNAGRLRAALDVALNRSDIVITTGGLGPTMDDLTKETIAEYWGLKLVPHQPSLDAMREFFTRTGRTMTANNEKQALFPEDAIVLDNPHGTAPGCILTREDKTIIILPGPPHELQPMFINLVRPYLMERSGHRITSVFLKVCGIGESEVEYRLRDIVAGQSNPTIAPYASPGDVMLRVTARTALGEDPDRLLKPVVEAIHARLDPYVYSDSGESLAECVVGLMTRRGLTLSIAESCTGGLLSSMVVDVPGASAVLDQCIVAYSNRAKVDRLAVPQALIDRHGAVSEEVARAMAEGVRRLSGTDYAVSTTGISGPGGGTPRKPVGLVYIAVADREGCVVERYVMPRSRSAHRTVTALHGLRMLRERILGITPR